MNKELASLLFRIKRTWKQFRIFACIDWWYFAGLSIKDTYKWRSLLWEMRLAFLRKKIIKERLCRLIWILDEIFFNSRSYFQRFWKKKFLKKSIVNSFESMFASKFYWVTWVWSPEWDGVNHFLKIVLSEKIRAQISLESESAHKAKWCDFVWSQKLPQQRFSEIKLQNGFDEKDLAIG